MANPAATVVAAGFIIFRRFTTAPEYLLLQTSYGKHHWTPPKGHVDPGESEFDTALRETLEESGLTRGNLRIMDGFQKTLYYSAFNKPKKVVYWLAEVIDPEAKVVLSDEHQNFKWLPIGDIVKVSNFSDLNKALEEADDFIAKL